MLTPYFQKCIDIQVANFHDLLKALQSYFLNIELKNGEKNLVDFFKNHENFFLSEQQEEIYTFESEYIKIIIDQEKWKNEIFYYDDNPNNLVKHIKLIAQKANNSVYSFKVQHVDFSNNDSFFTKNLTYITIYEMYKQEEIFIYSSNQKKTHQFLYLERFLGATDSIYFGVVKNILETDNPELLIRERIKEYLNTIFVGDFLNTQVSEHSVKSRKPVHYRIYKLNISHISWVTNYHAILYRKERQKPSVFNLTPEGKIKDYFYVMGASGNHKVVNDFIIEHQIPITKNYDWPKEYIDLARMNNLFNND